MASVKNILPHILNGQNASVFAYGPTGAGMLPSFALHTVYKVVCTVVESENNGMNVKSERGY